MGRSKRTFSAEFREKAVAYVVEQNKSIAGAARELGIGESTLANWIKIARQEESGAGQASARFTWHGPLRSGSFG
jgi:transposase-like protein